MNTFTIFFYNILVKYSPKRTKLHHLKKILEGTCPQTPLATRGLATRCMARNAAVCAMQIPLLLQKYFEPPPPPRNEILDAPLQPPQPLVIQNHLNLTHIGDTYKYY